MTLSMFILSLFQHGFKVRWTTAYFVLIGKKTSSVLTYASCYQLLSYFHLFPKLQKHVFYQELEQLEKEHYIVIDGDWVILTNEGKHQLKHVDFSSVHFLNRFYDYKEKERIFQSLLLMMQMMSEYSYHNRHYLPVTTNLTIQAQMKQKWKQLQVYPFTEVQPVFLEEIQRLLLSLSLKERYLLSAQFTGHEIIAKTNEQLALELSHTVFEVELWLESIKSYLCQLSQTDFPLLYFILQPHYNQQNALYRAVALGVSQYESIAQMSQRLHKKEGTILDYVVEVALYTAHFPYDNYLQGAEAWLETYYQQHPNVGSWVFKEIKQQQPQLPFYQVRLFQIKKGQEQWQHWKNI